MRNTYTVLRLNYIYKGETYIQLLTPLNRAANYSPSGGSTG